MTGKLSINLKALAANYQLLQARVGPDCAVAASVKADAYGLGAAQVIPALLQAGCETFFVATLDEALELRLLTPKAVIYTLNGLAVGREEAYETHHIRPCLCSRDEVERWRGRNFPAALHFDTGITRLGLPEAEPKLFQGIDIQLVMSHFACADEKDHPMNEAQYQRFMQIARHFSGVKRSLCNSSGVFLKDDYHLDLVRPGMALYGLNPTPYADNPMQPVVWLEVPVIQVKHAAAGDTAGYNATYQFAKDAAVAVVAMGYADGFFRSLSNQGALYYKGARCPVRGRVSMDLTLVDISAVPEQGRPKPGDMMEVIGPHQSADDLAVDAGTIGYEILTSLGKRYERIYV